MSKEEEFITACKEGNLELAQLILQNNPTIDISANNNSAFVDSCYLGYLDIVQWLYTIIPIIDISAFDEAFKWACYYGQLDIAQWLYSIKPDMNISGYYKCYLSVDNINKHLDMEQLQLYSITKPNANSIVVCTTALVRGYPNKYLNVMKWLQSLYPFKYSIHIYKDEDDYIRYEYKINNTENLLFILYALEYKCNKNNVPPDTVTNIANYF